MKPYIKQTMSTDPRGGQDAEFTPPKPGYHLLFAELRGDY